MSMYYIGMPEFLDRDIKDTQKKLKKDSSKDKKGKQLNIFEAFDLMHIQDGTKDRKRCATSYL